MMNIRRLLLLGVVAVAAAAMITTAQAGIISGSFEQLDGTAYVDLTAEGGVDWAIWGLGADGSTGSGIPGSSKAGGNAISSITIGGTGYVEQIAAWPSNPMFTWIDGTDVASATDVPAGLAARTTSGTRNDPEHVLNPMSFTVAADTAVQVLRLYVGSYNADGNLVASLSDSSATDYVYLDAFEISASDKVGVFEIAFAADSAGQTLNVQWYAEDANMGGWPNVHISAATVVPEPVSIALLGLGVVAMPRHRK